MHVRIEEVLAFIDTHRAALAQTLSGVPTEVRDRRPATERWSIGEVLGHLAVVEGRVTNLLRTGIESARAAGLAAERESGAVVPTLDIARILDRSRPITASAGAQPPAGIHAETAWAGLQARRAALREVVISADGLALEEVTAPNPVLGTLNAYQWIVFIGAHEARHTAQIREIAAVLTA